MARQPGVGGGERPPCKSSLEPDSTQHRVLVVTGPGKYEIYPFRSAVVETEAGPNKTSITYAENEPGVWADPKNASIA